MEKGVDSIELGLDSKLRFALTTNGEFVGDASSGGGTLEQRVAFGLIYLANNVWSRIDAETTLSFTQFSVDWNAALLMNDDDSQQATTALSYASAKTRGSSSFTTSSLPFSSIPLSFSSPESSMSTNFVAVNDSVDDPPLTTVLLIVGIVVAILCLLGIAILIRVSRREKGEELTRAAATSQYDIVPANNQSLFVSARTNESGREYGALGIVDPRSEYEVGNIPSAL